jgi:hypothetical protein
MDGTLLMPGHNMLYIGFGELIIDIDNGATGYPEYRINTLLF